MQSGGRKITDLKVYYCGRCMNDFSRVYKDVPSEEKKIPAVAVLFKHNDDFYLFDTGYSTRVLENGLYSRLYGRLNPVIVSESDSLVFQIEKDGIRADDIKGIILSHLHPDHIGGLIDFPRSRIFVSKNTYSVFQKPSLMDLVFTNMLPPDFEKRAEILDFEDEYDLFGDGSAILKDVSGHTLGQTGLLLPEYNTFYAADGCWSSKLMDKSMKFTGRFLQKDYGMYKRTIEKLIHMQSEGVRIVFCHEVRDE